MKTEDYIFVVCFFLAILGFIGLPLGLVFLLLNMLDAAVWSFLGAIGALSLCGLLDAIFGDGDVIDDSCGYVSNNCYSNGLTDGANESSNENIIMLKDTHCAACGAPLEDDTCSYCKTKAVIYKKIR